MHVFWTALFGLVALFWVIQTTEIALGVMSMPRLEDAEPLAPEKCPSVSILVTARDEAKKLPQAIETFLALDYPDYEVVAVDDRSEDGTREILEAAAKKNSRLKAIRVDALPEDWLGKPHGLQTAYENSRGEWLVFTDGDVSFAPDVVRRAMALAMQKGWDHLTLLGRAEMYGFFEKIAMTFFGFGFALGTKPWRAHDPRSSGYIGVGAFQLIRRSSYEKMGTHRQLRMEVIDDMKLGKVMKESGARSGAAKAGDAVSVHWHDGVRNMVRGTTKNFFASSGFRLWLTTLRASGLLVTSVLPFVALPFLHGWALAFDVVAAALPALVHAGAAMEFGESPLWGLSHPIGALIFVWMLTRSTVITLWQGGIVWRGTFYPLDELKRGVV